MKTPPDTDKDWCHTFGKLVRASREAKGWTQTDLGNMIGLVRSSVANMEAGRQTPSAPMAARLVALLGVSPPGWSIEPSAVAQLLDRQADEIHRLRDVLVVIRERAAAVTTGQQ